MSTSSGSRRRSPIAGAEAGGVVDGDGGVDGDAAQVGRERRRAVEVAALGLEAVGEDGGGVAVAAVLEHAGEQLLDRLLGFQRLEALLLARQHQARLELQQGGDQDEEFGRDLEVELTRLLEVVDVGDDDLAELQLEQADLLAQDDGEEEVEGPGEDVEVQIQIGDRHRGQTRDAPRRPEAFWRNLRMGGTGHLAATRAG